MGRMKKWTHVHVWGRRSYIKLRRVELLMKLHLRATARDVTCYVGSHRVTCHPTQVNTPRLNPNQQSNHRTTATVEIMYGLLRCSWLIQSALYRVHCCQWIGDVDSVCASLTRWATFLVHWLLLPTSTVSTHWCTWSVSSADSNFHLSLHNRQSARVCHAVSGASS